MRVAISLGFCSFCCFAHQMEVGLDLHKLERQNHSSDQITHFFLCNFNNEDDNGAPNNY